MLAIPILRSATITEQAWRRVSSGSMKTRRSEGAGAVTQPADPRAGNEKQAQRLEIRGWSRVSGEDMKTNSRVRDINHPYRPPSAEDKNKK